MDVLIDGDIETEAGGLGYGAMMFTVAPGVTTESHSHASEETWIVQSGKGHCVIDGRRIGLIAGARIVAPARSVHSIANSGTDDLEVLGFWWKRL